MWFKAAVADIGASLARVWSYRDLCLHLAFADLRARFRRSYLGIVWAMLQPLLMTVVLSLVLIFVFEQPFAQYSIYVYTGVISWEFIAAAFTLGAASLVGAEGYLKQARIPLAIFAFKVMLHATVIFLIAFVGFVIFALAVKPEIIGVTWLLLPVFWLVAIFSVTPFAVISSILNMRVRDYQQAIGLVLQAAMYVSPVFLAREIFEKGYLAKFTFFNPVAAYLDFFRAITVYNKLPTTHDVVACLLYGAFFWIVAIVTIHRNEKKIIYLF